jgi:flagellar basal-body rod protein FlgG
MTSELYTLTSGMVAQWARFEILANNLANADTPGFKADDLIFKPIEPPADSTVAPLGLLPSGPWPPQGVEIEGQVTDFRQGPLRQTDRPLDVALDGPGFLVVETPAGPRYTRAGNFTLDRDGFLVTAGGHRVLGQGGPISVPGPDVSVDRQGRVQSGGETIDTLRVVDFPLPYAFLKEGGQLLRPRDPAAAPTNVTGTEVVGGALEGSNVGLIESMVTMIETLRTFEAYQRMIQSVDQTLQRATNDLGRV